MREGPRTLAATLAATLATMLATSLANGVLVGLPSSAATQHVAEPGRLEAAAQGGQISGTRIMTTMNATTVSGPPTRT
ncbi:hypothetical protein BH23GEM9_BH23GEM9_00330 [soil metagenome]